MEKEKQENTENILIPNQERLDSLLKQFKEGGKDKIHVLADFDRTLTKAFVDGQKSSTIFAQIRNLGYLGNDYVKQAHQLFDTYHPIEISSSIPLEEKKQKMHEWWKKHFNLIIEKGLSRQIIEEIVAKGGIEFRKGINEFLDILKDNQIPLVILSSSGMADAIPMYFAKINRNYNNIHVVGNFFEFDKQGKVVAVKEPMIHILNKKEITLEKLPAYSQLLKRKNVILLGDNIADIDMIEGFAYDNLIKIGFLNENIEENLPEFKKNFDAIILNDGEMGFVNQILEQII